MMASAQQILILKKYYQKIIQNICLPIVLIVCKIGENYYSYYF